MTQAPPEDVFRRASQTLSCVARCDVTRDGFIHFICEGGIHNVLKIRENLHIIEQVRKGAEERVNRKESYEKVND